jgi:hypothetical protein
MHEKEFEHVDHKLYAQQPIRNSMIINHSYPHPINKNKKKEGGRGRRSHEIEI